MHIGDTLTREHRLLLTGCQRAYRKHALGDESIGWGELAVELETILSEVMGSRYFADWIKAFGGNNE